MEEVKFCDYGCGREAKFLLKFKHFNKWCCSKKYSSCKSNIKPWNKGLKKETDQRVFKYSKNKLGKPSWNKGLKKETDQRVKKISESNIGKKISNITRKKISFNLRGKIHSVEHNRKISESNKGKISWSKGLTKYNNYSLMKISKKMRNRCVSAETKEKLKKNNTGKKLKEETKIKISLKNIGKKRSEKQIKNIIDSKKGTKHFKIKYYQLEYPELFKFEEIKEDNQTKDLFVKCSVCEKYYIPKRNQISYRAEMINLSKINQGLFYCSNDCKEKFLYKYKKEYEIYCSKVWKETRKSLKNNKIKNIEVRGKKYKFHLDHKFSIVEGFKNLIDPKIVGNWKNLEVISENENIKKLGKCSITLEQLIKDINQVTN